MDLVLRVAQVITPVFLIIGVGYFYGRRHNPDLTVLNRVALDVLTPAIIYAGLASRGFQLAEHGKLLLGMLGMMLGCGLIGWPLARWLGVQPRTLVPVLMFNNSGNMGLPVALLAFGQAHFGAAVMLFAVGTLLHFSLGARITNPAARTGDMLKSPVVIAAVLGFASALSGLRPPEPVMIGIRMLGDACLPLMLFTLGVRLIALTRAGWRLGLAGALARPILGMALTLALAWLLGITGVERAQLVLYGALPPAVIQYLLAERYGQEPEKVAAMTLLGNAFALVFVPLALLIGL